VGSAVGGYHPGTETRALSRSMTKSQKQVSKCATSPVWSSLARARMIRRLRRGLTQVGCRI